MQIGVRLSVGEGKRAELNGTRLPAPEQLRSEVVTLVFTPDRLAIVKGGPSVRRAYFDRALGRAWPGRSALSAEYGLYGANITFIPNSKNGSAVAFQLKLLIW